MIRFQQKTQPRNYLSPREQRRLLWLVLSLGLVVILICEARKPDNWQWMENLDVEWVPGTIGGSSEDAESGDDETEGPPAGKLFAGVDAVLLKTVEDNTRFRDEEKAAWFNLLGVLKRADESRLRRESIGRVSWLQLHEQSAEYRGELVSVRGAVRRATRVDAPENDEDIDGYYQVWFQPDDNPSRPVVAYCLELPQNFPTGMELDEPAEITGFYFKRWLYLGRENLETSPVMLAKTVSWKKSGAVKSPPSESFDSVYFVIAAGAVVGLLAFAYIVYRTRRRPRQRRQPPAELNFNILLDEEEKTKEEDGK